MKNNQSGQAAVESLLSLFLILSAGTTIATLAVIFFIRLRTESIISDFQLCWHRTQKIEFCQPQARRQLDDALKGFGEAKIHNHQQQNRLITTISIRILNKWNLEFAAQLNTDQFLINPVWSRF